jgi:hypothetical protein
MVEEKVHLLKGFHIDVELIPDVIDKHDGNFEILVNFAEGFHMSRTNNRWKR